jgi:hypothetical protein
MARRIEHFVAKEIKLNVKLFLFGLLMVVCYTGVYYFIHKPVERDSSEKSPPIVENTWKELEEKYMKLNEYQKKRFLLSLSDEYIPAYISMMGEANAAEILSDLPYERKRKVLALIEKKDSPEKDEYDQFLERTSGNLGLQQEMGRLIPEIRYDFDSSSLDVPDDYYSSKSRKDVMDQFWIGILIVLLSMLARYVWMVMSSVVRWVEKTSNEPVDEN